MSNYDRNAAYGSGVATVSETDAGLRAYMLGIYNNMILGLAISGLVAIGVNKMAVAASAAEGVARIGANTYLTSFGALIYTSPLKWVVMLAPLAFIFLFSFGAQRMSAAGVRTAFFAFAAVMGLSLSSIFLVYKLGSISQVFFMTAAAFGALSLYGYTTQRSLSGFGSFLIMGAIGLMLASIVNLFLQSSMLQFAISAIGVLVFAGLTAYDTQKLKEMYIFGDMSGEEEAKASVFGALTLYLDFINMFQFLLTLMGQREE
jgi:FtsH-binding integral membrane protein